ncbi:MAG: type III polyketide synthase, partial [Planctomycetota bacterium]
AVIGLRTAAGACLATPGATALVVCLELCSLHLRDDRDVQNQVASALFADGAAAAVVSAPDGGGDGPSLGRVHPGRSLLLPDGQPWMSWRVTDHGFRKTLAREDPGALRGAVRDFVEGDDLDSAAPTLVVHPGGPEILDAVDDALDLRGGRGLAASRAVLRRYGNMSSATLLFVLDEALRAGEPLPMVLLAFGPGLAIESVRLDAADHDGRSA